MKSFKRAIYKTGLIEEPEVSCNDTLNVNGAEGIYEVDITIGTDIGITGLRYEAFNVPDRFQLFFDEVKVADSKYVGDINMYGDQLDGLSKTLPIFKYDGTSFVDSGLTEVVTITPTDIANGSTSEPTSGKGELKFDKTEGNVVTMKLRVIGVLGGTLWNAAPVCPNQFTASSSSTTTPTSLKVYDMVYYAFISAMACEDLDFGGNTEKFYSTGYLAVGTKMFTNTQLTQKVPTGYLYLGRTIYEIDEGVIVDIYPCHKGLGI